MKSFRKVLTLFIAVFMVMQVIMPSLSLAVDTIKLNIQSQRPYSDDDGDGIVGDDIYTLVRSATQTIFKIGEQIGLDENGKPVLNHDNAYSYYCLRGGLGFGGTAQISQTGVDYTELANLSDKTAVIEYFRDTIGIEYDMPEANYNAICWIARNMYLPKNENAAELKEKLLDNAGITNSLLTDDDIEVVQQMALWYFTNYDENRLPNSVSLDLTENLKLSNLLKINDESANNDTQVLYNKNRAKQIDTLYEYFVNKALANEAENILLYGDANSDGGVTEEDAILVLRYVVYPEGYFLTETGKTNADVNLDGQINEDDAVIIQKYVQKEKGYETLPYMYNVLNKDLEPVITQKQVQGINAFVVGPFKINDIKRNDYTFSYTLKYKTSSTQEEWSILEIDNTLKTVYLSDENGILLDNRVEDIADMIGGNQFYITILNDVIDISNISEFGLDIAYESFYYNTSAKVLVAEAKDQPVLKIEKTKVPNNGNDSIVIKPEEKEFDLALRKFITGVNDEKIDSRIPELSLEELRKGAETATYEHSKTAIYLKRGDIVVYTIRVYNEGDLDGYATEVTDYLCDDLEFVEGHEINETYGWEVSEDGYLTTDYLADKKINAYDPDITVSDIDREETWQQAEDGEDGLYYADLQVACRIKTDAQEKITLPNVAEISADKAVDETGTEVIIDDRDSTPANLTEDERRNYEGNPWLEDDDDYERVIIEPDKVFDLSLRKYISNIERKGENVEFTSRVPQVDTTPFTQNISTANYIHPKDVLTVKQGDIITYKLRVYNEGELDGYVAAITDYIPEGLGLLVGYSGNSNWLIESTEVENKPLVGENGIYKTEQNVPKQGIFENEDLTSISVVTGKNGVLKIRDYLSLKDELIKKYGADVEDGDLFQVSTNNQDDGLFYQEIEVTCIVLAPNTYEGTITNIAEISVDKAVEIDETGTEVEINVNDRDSRPNNVMEDGRHTPGTELNGYTPGEQDDDDYEPVQLKYFDLALRKFITGVNETEVNTRIPQVTIDEEGNIKYEHTKEPVEVVDNDNVTYTIRVYNEGTIAGFAEEIEDDIPEGLIFLPENETNKQYGWKMYYYNEEGVLTETEKVEDATFIRTNFLSEANGTVNEETGKNSNLLEIFNRETMSSPDYRDVKVVFKVSEEDIPEENEDGIIINKAHITDDSDDDEDSIPDKWNEGEDDQDIEKIKVQKFDLALFKWVSQTVVTVDNKTTTTETGFKPNIGNTEQFGENYRNNSEEEPIASVTIDKKKINSTTVKFVYNIKVVNEGDIAGFATEVTDYIPEGLKFVAEDNPLWTLAEEGKITTRGLETKLLNPGDSAEVQVTFTWINDANNLGLKTNIAAITEDYNEKGIQDEDSDPENEDIANYEKEQEDDDDFALVILTLKTGKGISYVWLLMVIITIISSGAILIKKYVL